MPELTDIETCCAAQVVGKASALFGLANGVRPLDHSRFDPPKRTPLVVLDEGPTTGGGVKKIGPPTVVLQGRLVRVNLAFAQRRRSRRVSLCSSYLLMQFVPSSTGLLLLQWCVPSGIDCFIRPIHVPNTKEQGVHTEEKNAQPRRE